MAARSREAELLEFLFLPGFSTARQVTEISGRGVGLDVVQDMVQRGRRRRCASPRAPAADTDVPPAAADHAVGVRAVVVEIAGEPYAFPLTRIDRRCSRGAATRSASLEGRQFVTVERPERRPGAGRQVLELDDAPRAGDEARRSWSSASDRRAYGAGRRRASRASRTWSCARSTPASARCRTSAPPRSTDGRPPVLIVDVDDLVRSIDAPPQRRRGCGRARGARGRGARARASACWWWTTRITVREVERQLLENRGYDVDVAVDGMDGWNASARATFDLVVTDVDMPRMNGIELVPPIKQDATPARTCR